MSSPTLYKKGDWKAVCDVCGQRYLMSKLRKRWDGLMVCPNDFEPRQPQDFVRAKVDIQAVPVARPESLNYNFEAVNYDRSYSDALGVRDTVSILISKVLTDTLSITESVSQLRILHTNPTDTVTITDSVAKLVGKPLSDTLSITESTSVNPLHILSDSTTIGESVVVRATFRQASTDTLSITESVSTSLLIGNFNSLNANSLNSNPLG